MITAIHLFNLVAYSIDRLNALLRESVSSEYYTFESLDITNRSLGMTLADREWELAFRAAPVEIKLWFAGNVAVAAGCVVLLSTCTLVLLILFILGSFYPTCKPYVTDLVWGVVDLAAHRNLNTHIRLR